MTLLPLNPDELLSTTRAVRKRLDFGRAVPAQLILECVAMAVQAPSGSNIVTARFVVITDADKRQAIGQIYREIYAGYKASPHYPADQHRVANSADYLGEHMGDAPVLVIAVNTGPDHTAAARGASNVLPAAWSFMLAARARGLGTAWTTMHLAREREVADLLGIPYDTVAQAVLTPVAFTVGTSFRPANRPEPGEFIRWNTW